MDASRSKQHDCCGQLPQGSIINSMQYWIALNAKNEAQHLLHEFIKFASLGADEASDCTRQELD